MLKGVVIESDKNQEQLNGLHKNEIDRLLAQFEQERSFVRCKLEEADAQIQTLESDIHQLSITLQEVTTENDYLQSEIQLIE